MAADRLDVIARLRQRLRTDAQPAGWGYYRGKGARIEPTAWALLALATDESAVASTDWAPFVEQHLSLFSTAQQNDGLLRDPEHAAH